MLFAGTLVNRTGGFVLVFLTIYLTEVRGLSAAQAGAVVSAYGIGAIGGGPFGGAISDRIGRRPTLVVSLIGGGASMLLFGLVIRMPAMIAAAAMTGLLCEMYRPVVSATLADVVPSADRPRAYALIYWAVNLGASIAPLLGAVVAARSYPALFAIDGATTALYGVICWAALPETRPRESHMADSRASGIRVILADAAFLGVCVLSFAFSIVFFQSFVGLPIDMRAHGMSAATFGGVIALNGLLIVLFQPAAGELIRARSRPLTLAGASLLLAAGFGLTAWAGSPTGYAACVTIWTLGEILFAPASMALVADMAPAHLRGAYQGGFALAFTTAFAVAPVAGGSVIARAGAHWLWMACLAIGAVTALGFIALHRTDASTRGRGGTRDAAGRY